VATALGMAPAMNLLFAIRHLEPLARPDAPRAGAARDRHDPGLHDIRVGTNIPGSSQGFCRPQASIERWLAIIGDMGLAGREA